MAKKKEKRFTIKSEQGLNLGGIYVVEDTVTGVHYIVVGGASPSGITPLLDSNGKIVIEKTVSNSL